MMILAFAAFPFYLFSLWKRPLLFIGFALQVAYIISRGFTLGRLPLVGPHDTLIFIAVAIAAFSLPFYPKLKDHRRFYGGIALTAAAFTIVALISKQHNAQLEGMQYRSIFIGYSLFSLSMIFGGVWAYLAWGTYWLWTPKELWTTILWLFYSLYLHARLRPWWMGRPSAILGIAGFAVVLFTYLGVSLLMKSSHSF